jgi:hypothetical protein
MFVCFSQNVRALAAFRLGAHHYEVSTGRWTRTPRAERLCALCHGGLGDEFHVVFECPAQEVPRRMHATLFERFGGWSELSPVDRPLHPGLSTWQQSELLGFWSVFIPQRWFAEPCTSGAEKGRALQMLCVIL